MLQNVVYNLSAIYHALKLPGIAIALFLLFGIEIWTVGKCNKVLIPLGIIAIILMAVFGPYPVL